MENQSVNLSLRMTHMGSPIKQCRIAYLYVMPFQVVTMQLENLTMMKRMVGGMSS